MISLRASAQGRSATAFTGLGLVLRVLTPVSCAHEPLQFLFARGKASLSRLHKRAMRFLHTSCAVTRRRDPSPRPDNVEIGKNTIVLENTALMLDSPVWTATASLLASLVRTCWG